MEGFNSLTIDTRANLASVDESQLSFRDRIGLACCRVNCYVWDPFLGPEPKGKDAMHYAHRALRSILGEAECSRYWHKFALGRSDEQWLRWFVQEWVTDAQKLAEANSKGAQIRKLLRVWKLWR